MSATQWMRFESACYTLPIFSTYGLLAQMARAPALQAGGHRFESDTIHKTIANGNLEPEESKIPLGRMGIGLRGSDPTLDGTIVLTGTLAERR